ncbi:MAG: hypothetical protein ACJ763_20035 [Bdellovibrionia bacterium]
MSSWIYILSKFTPEALLFEALLICVLVSSYAAFWVLRKRRFGAIEDEVPASVVKVYLNELIGEAEDMRTQLFGLLSGHAPRPRHAHADAHISSPSFVVSGDAAEKLTALEQKMAEQAAAMERIMSEKAKLEKELNDARANGAAAGGASAGGEDVQKLQEKCQSLEARLAEYSVIEDDLANLKRLQQENAQLKTQLASGGAGATAAGPAVPATPAATAAPSTPAAAEPEAAPAPAEAAPAPAAEAAPATPADPEAAAAAAAVAAATAADAPSSTVMDQDAIQAMLDSAGTAPSTPAAAPAPSAASNEFEGLVDEVEKSLQPNAPAPAAAATPAAPAQAETKAEKTPEKVPEKSDEDLIAEFEKMLNS